MMAELVWLGMISLPNVPRSNVAQNVHQNKVQETVAQSLSTALYMFEYEDLPCYVSDIIWKSSLFIALSVWAHTVLSRLQHKSVLSGRYVKSIPLIHLNTASYHTAEVHSIAGTTSRQSYCVIGSGYSGGPVTLPQEHTSIFSMFPCYNAYLTRTEWYIKCRSQPPRSV
jgi:hypothetical protein